MPEVWVYVETGSFWCGKCLGTGKLGLPSIDAHQETCSVCSGCGLLRCPACGGSGTAPVSDKPSI